MIPRIFFEVSLEDDHYDLNRPFVADGYLRATNGRIFVRSEDSCLETDEIQRYASIGRKLPRTALMSPLWSAERAGPIPLVKGCEPILVCDQCLPRWRGTYPLSPNLRADCGECLGGWIWNMDSIPHGDVLLSARYVALLESHGVTEIYPTARESATSAVYFRGEGFEGLLMPMTPFPVNSELGVA